jgi:hypothetical protein
MAKFQCLRTLVAELNSLENRLFLANVTMPNIKLDPVLIDGPPEPLLRSADRDE